MKSANREAMQEALQRRKANGLDITILIGDPSDDGESAEEKDEAERRADNVAPKGTPVDDEYATTDGGPGVPSMQTEMAGMPPEAMAEEMQKGPGLMGRGSLFKRRMMKG